MKTRCRKCHRQAPLISGLCSTCHKVVLAHDTEQIKQDSIKAMSKWRKKGTQ